MARAGGAGSERVDQFVGFEAARLIADFGVMHLGLAL